MSSSTQRSHGSTSDRKSRPMRREDAPSGSRTRGFSDAVHGAIRRIRSREPDTVSDGSEPGTTRFRKCVPARALTVWLRYRHDILRSAQPIGNEPPPGILDIVRPRSGPDRGGAKTRRHGRAGGDYGSDRPSGRNAGQVPQARQRGKYDNTWHDRITIRTCAATFET